LHAYDEDFQKLFKVKADFSTTMDRTPDTELEYALFVHTICQEHNLLPFDRSAIARLIEHSSRMVEHQEKLSTRFGEISDLLHEASYWAGQRFNAPSIPSEQAGHKDKTVVTAIDIEQAISGELVTKVVYLPNADNAEIAIAGVESLVSVRLDPDVDPLQVAQRQGYTLAIFRLGNRSPEDTKGDEAGEDEDQKRRSADRIGR
jgi:hypothetical protein